MSSLTDAEMAAIEAITTEEAWNDLCTTIKRSHGGGYPYDWFERVNRSGLMARIFARFNQPTLRPR